MLDFIGKFWRLWWNVLRNRLNDFIGANVVIKQAIETLTFAAIHIRSIQPVLARVCGCTSNRFKFEFQPVNVFDFYSYHLGIL